MCLVLLHALFSFQEMVSQIPPVFQTLLILVCELRTYVSAMIGTRDYDVFDAAVDGSAGGFYHVAVSGDMQYIAGVSGNNGDYLPGGIVLKCYIFVVDIPLIFFIERGTEVDGEAVWTEGTIATLCAEREWGCCHECDYGITGMPAKIAIFSVGDGFEEFPPRCFMQSHLCLYSGITKTGGCLQRPGTVGVDDAVDIKIAPEIDFSQVGFEGGEDFAEEPVVFVSGVPEQSAHFTGFWSEVTWEKLLMFDIQFDRADPVSAVEIASNSDFDALDAFLENITDCLSAIASGIIAEQTDNIATV